MRDIITQWRLRDSNSRPPACKAGALPTELSPHKSGSHLLSHTVSSIVPSAAYVLTIVFGMRTGVSHKRIATKNVLCCRFTPSMLRLPFTLGIPSEHLALGHSPYAVFRHSAFPCASTAHASCRNPSHGLLRQQDLPLGKSTVIQPLLLP